MNNSTMNIPPISTESDSNEYTFNKQSISMYAQKSILKNTLVFSAKTEIINMTRDSMIVNNTFIPQQTNSGINALELNTISYLNNFGGWKNYAKLGYNIKGNSQNDNIRFAIPNNEYGFGIVLMKDKKPRGIISPIIQGILNSTETTIQKLEINMYYGQNYLFSESNFIFIKPLLKQINAKILYTNKQYSFSESIPLFINQKKILVGLIVKSRSYNALEFDLYHDFISNEFGASLGINYFIKEKHDGLQYKMLNYYEKRYLKHNNTRKISKEKTEIEEEVNRILEEKGF